jgi:hypothetical protein
MSIIHEAANNILAALRAAGVKDAASRPGHPGHSVYVETGPGRPAALVKDYPRLPNMVDITYFGLQTRPEGVGYPTRLVDLPTVARVLIGELDVWDSAPDFRLEKRSKR